MADHSSCSAANRSSLVLGANGRARRRRSNSGAPVAYCDVEGFIATDKVVFTQLLKDDAV